MLGVPVVPSDDDLAAWLVELHRVLNRDDDSIPAALQAALIEISDLATELGHEIIVAQAIDRGVDLFAIHTSLSLQDLAFYAHDAHPAIFRAAHARLLPQNAPRFVEFYGDYSAKSSPQNLEKRVEEARARLSAHSRARNRTHFCQAWADDFGSELVFVFVRGGPPDSVASVLPRADQVVTYVREQHDVVLYHRELDRLSICTPYPADQSYYQALMGLVLASREEYFRSVPIFHGEPLKERGSAALDIGGIPELVRVSLRKITLLGRDERESTLQFESEDLRDALDHGPLRSVLQQRSIGAWTFGVLTRQNATPGEVDILPPNQLRFDRRVPLGPLRQFLTMQGFLRPPPRPSR